MGVARLAAELGVGLAEAAAAADSFKRSLPGVDAWVRGVIAGCRSSPAHATMTLLGRRRCFPGIGAKAPGARAAAERGAVNTVCQGSAADLVKVAMLRLHAALAAPRWAGRAAMVLMIHDELVFEVEAGLAGALASEVRAIMEGAGDGALRVPLPVKISVGRSWGELEELRPGG